MWIEDVYITFFYHSSRFRFKSSKTTTYADRTSLLLQILNLWGLKIEIPSGLLRLTFKDLSTCRRGPIFETMVKIDINLVTDSLSLKEKGCLSVYAINIYCHGTAQLRDTSPSCCKIK